MIEIPDARFELSGARHVLQSIQTEGALHVIDELDQNEEHQRLADYMRTVYGFVMPPPGSPREQIAAHYFIHAPSLIFQAFMESDLVEPTSTQALAKLKIVGSIPQALVVAAVGSRDQVVAEMNTETHERHPEAGKLIMHASGHIAEGTGDSHIGYHSMAGMYFALGQLDRAWESVRAPLVDGLADAQVQALDWEAETAGLLGS